MKYIKALIIASLIALATVNYSSAQDLDVLPEPDRYSTSELIDRTVAGIKDCIEWCITKVQIQILYTGYTVEVYVVPIIEHNIPDYLVMTGSVLENTAYEKWAEHTAEPQRLIQQIILSLTTGIGVEVWGGLTEYEDFGQHQSVRFFESEIIGNPVSYFFKLMGRDGHVVGEGDLSPDPDKETKTEDNPPVATNESDDSTGGYLAKWMEVAAGCLENGCRGILSFFGDFAKFFNVLDSIAEIREKIATAGMIADILENFEEIKASVTEAGSGFGADFAMESYVCASEATGFFPYYLSSIDSVVYRSGYPFVDFIYTTRFFSPDNIVRPTGALLLEDWGWVIPRTGFLNNEHGGRTAPVIAKRAQSVASDGNSIFRYRFLIPDSGKWQKVSPNPSEFCETNIADLDTSIDGGEAYSYNFWPRYECITATKGIPVATIDIPDICI